MSEKTNHSNITPNTVGNTYENTTNTIPGTMQKGAMGSRQDDTKHLTQSIATEEAIKSKRALAMSLFSSGMNCAQAAFVAFCDETGMDRETAMRISSSFGGGIGRLREVCGAVSGIAMAAGMLYGNFDPLDQDAKAAHYAFVQDLALQFKEENGSYICRELLALPEGPDSPTPEKRTETYYKLRPCAEYVGNAAEIFQKALIKRHE